MQPSVVRQLLDLNALFYQTFAGSFSATRGRIQPGVRRVIDTLVDVDRRQRVLDAGCGNGELARVLMERGFAGLYVGVDGSQGLIEEARRRTSPPPLYKGRLLDKREAGLGGEVFLHANLADPLWPAGLPAGGFDLAFAFAVLHHLPSLELRLDVLRALRGQLAAGGRLALSNWQYRNSPRLAARVLPWERVGLNASDVDPGDDLLDWRAETGAGQPGLRYAHHFSLDELAWLAAESGFRVVETFSSDGKEGNLGLYQVWE